MINYRVPNYLFPMLTKKYCIFLPFCHIKKPYFRELLFTIKKDSDWSHRFLAHDPRSAKHTILSNWHSVPIRSNHIWHTVTLKPGLSLIYFRTRYIIRFQFSLCWKFELNCLACDNVFWKIGVFKSTKGLLYEVLKNNAMVALYSSEKINKCSAVSRWVNSWVAKLALWYWSWIHYWRERGERRRRRGGRGYDKRTEGCLGG